MFKDWLNLLLYVTVFAPLAGTAFVLLLRSYLAKYVAMTFASLPLIVGAGLYALYTFSPDSAQFMERDFLFYYEAMWFSVPNVDIKFMMGIDGISAYMLLLTGLIFPTLVVYAWNKEFRHRKLYYAMLLMMQTGILGFFLSLDLLMVYFFFEMVLIPASFFIGIWGRAKREEAAMKFFLYTLVGSLLMLIAIIYLALNTVEGILTTDYFAIRNALVSGDNPAFTLDIQRWIFLGFALSFAIKVPLFPLHTWQPLTYSTASTTGSVVLAALLSKMGVYGFIRFCLPLFPQTAIEFAPYISVLAVISIIYGAYLAVVQTDLKKLIAYASLSHLGFIVLGIFSLSPEAMSGAVLQMVAHGIATAALFLLAGMLYERYKTRDIRSFQGLAGVAPRFALLLMISVMAAVGLPGLSGFVGEFLILLGSFKSGVISGTFAVLAAIGVVIAAVYLINMFRRIMFGQAEGEAAVKMRDLSRVEMAVVMPLIALMFLIGIYASPFLGNINKGTNRVVAWVETYTAPETVAPLTESDVVIEAEVENAVN
ncbi:MAG: NADH-quinone oxidoreductase subunit M [Bacteroidia bacterium]